MAQVPWPRGHITTLWPNNSLENYCGTSRPSMREPKETAYEDLHNRSTAGSTPRSGEC